MKKISRNRRTQTISTNYSLCTSHCITPVNSNLYTLTTRKDLINCHKDSFKFEGILIDYFELDKKNKKLNKTCLDLLNKEKRIIQKSQRFLLKAKKVSELEKNIRFKLPCDLKGMEKSVVDLEDKNTVQAGILKKIVLDFFCVKDYAEIQSSLSNKISMKKLKILDLSKKLNYFKVKSRISADKLKCIAKERLEVEKILKNCENNLSVLRYEKQKIHSEKSELSSIFQEPPSPNYFENSPNAVNNNKIEELKTLQIKLKSKTEHNESLKSQIQYLKNQHQKSSETQNKLIRSTSSLASSIKQLQSSLQTLTSAITQKNSELSQKSSYLQNKESALFEKLSLIQDIHKQ